VDPHSGDVVYTEQLLAHPPPGVTYVTYDRAVAEGLLREVGSRGDVRSARQVGGVRGLVRSTALAGLRRVEHLARSSGQVFREPVRVLEADPRAFDLVHVHVFNTRFVGGSPPVVMSAAGPLEWVYRDAWGWSGPRTRRANAFDDVLGRALDATLHARRLGRAERFVAFSHHLRDVVVSRGFDPARVDVVPNYIDLGRPTTGGDGPGPGARPVRSLGFVAKDFEAKGGADVLAAFELLRHDRPDLTLTVVGSPPRMPSDELARRGITWRAFVPRDELVGRILPGLDVLLHPSRVDGLPYAPMEALAHGIPLVVSDYRALPELVAGGAGRVARTGDPADVARATRALLDPGAHASASAAAVAHFAAAYSARSQAPALRDAYDRALRGG
jgi:glycosyltransferase involved in cell wall biosynthesis